MTIFPLPLTDILGHWGAYIIYLLIGFVFGFVLEISGFGNSRKLAAQFYFTEMTVLKVMFSAIIVAMVLIFLSTALGLLDYNLIWVNPTYLVPGIVGGLIMGVGFIVGGFCPGTSLVSAATLKLDGIMFVLGVFFGIFLFGETVGLYEDFWFSTYMGRFTIMDLFNASTGVVVLLIVLAALLAFAGAEMAEKYIGKMNLAQFGKWRYGAAIGLVLIAVVVLFMGQPTNADRWSWIAEEREAQLSNREVQAHPAEVLARIHDPKLSVVLLDVRSISDYNQFHILDAEHLPMANVPERASELRLMPANTIFVLMSNDELAATEAWRLLVAESVPNVYILEGGINNWITTFADTEFVTESQIVDHPDDTLAFSFPSALGSRYAAADPNVEAFELEYEEKIKLQINRGPSGGGCG
jgi:rhodanese-related sulfurtransferase